ncbi:hypothetical protein IB267_12845 [Ensifer sp. ENS09]|uniref:hypothetical protein n=1 Tax=Ensifer sp. ENS09 TaxID=2769263 RepID=UPI00177C8818|nr:hypothetical protein [Ensifer sp. ENS09]MBD9649242.1 hypothetical protein [Ensifer sp. ENS09]
MDVKAPAMRPAEQSREFPFAVVDAPLRKTDACIGSQLACQKAEWDNQEERHEHRQPAAGEFQLRETERPANATGK